MMKRTLTFLVVFCMIGSPLWASAIEKEGTPERKLQRGFLNIVLSPLEMSNQLAKAAKRDSLVPSWIEGIGRGAVLTVGRALAGVYDLVTFPVSYPAGYEPLVSPEWPWEKLPANQ